MEVKKNERYDLDRKSPLFFSIGLVVALLCVTLAFEWRGEFDGMDIPKPKDPFEETYLVPSTAFPKPQPPKPLTNKPVNKPLESFLVKEGEELEDLKKDVIDMEAPIEIPLEPPVEVLPPEEVDQIEVFVETMPQFPGGNEAFY